MSFRLERLTAAHPVGEFDCGGQPGAAQFAQYLQDRALVEQQLGWSAVTLAVDDAAASETDVVVGFFTLSPLSTRIDPGVLQAMRLPAASYPAVGGYLLGRLGVSRRWQGRGLGRLLVERAIDAAQTAARSSGGVFLAVDPKNDRLLQWYLALGFGFVQLHPAQRRLVVRL